MTLHLVVQMWQILLQLVKFVEGSHLDEQCVGWVTLFAGRSPNTVVRFCFSFGRSQV